MSEGLQRGISLKSAAIESAAGLVLIKFVNREKNSKPETTPNLAIVVARFGVVSFSASHRDYFTLSIVSSKINIALAGMVGG